MACFIRGRGRGLTFGGRPDGDIPSPHLVFEVEEAWKKREKDVNRAQHRNASPNQERERERERKREKEREREREHVDCRKKGGTYWDQKSEKKVCCSVPSQWRRDKQQRLRERERKRKRERERSSF